MHFKRPIPDRLRAFIPLLAVLSVLATGLLPGLHAALGCRHAEHAANLAAHACHSNHLDADRCTCPASDDGDSDDDCPICLLIATTQHLGTGLVLPPTPFLTLAKTDDAATVPELPVLQARYHAPCATRGPPAAA